LPSGKCQHSRRSIQPPQPTEEQNTTRNTVAAGRDSTIDTASIGFVAATAVVALFALQIENTVAAATRGTIGTAYTGFVVVTDFALFAHVRTENTDAAATGQQRRRSIQVQQPTEQSTTRETVATDRDSTTDTACIGFVVVTVVVALLALRTVAAATSSTTGFVIITAVAPFAHDQTENTAAAATGQQRRSPIQPQQPTEQSTSRDTAAAGRDSTTDTACTGAVAVTVVVSLFVLQIEHTVAATTRGTIGTAFTDFVVVTTVAPLAHAQTENTAAAATGQQRRRPIQPQQPTE
jgi:tetrahydromethanopterin S-methyltransferase subunit B